MSRSTRHLTHLAAVFAILPLLPSTALAAQYSVTVDGSGNPVLVNPSASYAAPYVRLFYDTMSSTWTVQNGLAAGDQIVTPTEDLIYRGGSDPALYSTAAGTELPTIVGTVTRAAVAQYYPTWPLPYSPRQDWSVTVDAMDGTQWRLSWTVSFGVLGSISASKTSVSFTPTINYPSNPAMRQAYSGTLLSTPTSSQLFPDSLTPKVDQAASLRSYADVPEASGMGRLDAFLKQDTKWKLKDVWSGPQAILPIRTSRADVRHKEMEIELFNACFGFDASIADCEICSNAKAGYYVNISYSNMRIYDGYWVPTSITANAWSALTFRAHAGCDVVLGTGVKMGVALRTGTYYDFSAGLAADGNTINASVDAYARTLFRLKIKAHVLWFIKFTLVDTGFDKKALLYSKSWSSGPLLGYSLTDLTGSNTIDIEDEVGEPILGFSPNICNSSACKWGTDQPFNLTNSCGRIPIKVAEFINPTGSWDLVVQNGYGASNAFYGKTRKSCTGMHRGVDLYAPFNSRVVAAASGTVARAGWSTSYGNVVYINHTAADGTWWQTRYAHMTALSVSVGNQVAQGTLIGFAGMTGNADDNPSIWNAHVHFEIRQGHSTANSDKTVNPIPKMGY